MIEVATQGEITDYLGYEKNELQKQLFHKKFKIQIWKN
jgi:hypothetical protein